MLEWARKAAGAPAEGALVEHVNDWFACMTADAVVKARRGAARLARRRRARRGLLGAAAPCKRVAPRPCAVTQHTPALPPPRADPPPHTHTQTTQVSMGFDMHNIERKGAGDALHPLITAFREGIAACFGQADLRKELVGRAARGGLEV